MPLPFAFAAATAAAAATSAVASPHYQAIRVADGEAPVLDGKLDDAAWKKAPPSQPFVQKSPNEGAAPTEVTNFRVLYDKDAIYVGFDCSQVTYPIVSRLTRRDRDVEADAVYLDLDTHADGKSAFEFGVSAAGVLLDAQRYNDTDYSGDWDENWDARTDVRKDGWTVEIRIPFRVLRFPTRSVQTWGIEARRYISTRQEVDEWAFFPRAAGGEVSHYGKLDDLRDLHARTPFELRPFVVGDVRRRDVTSGQLAAGTDLHVSAGADVKWHPSQSLTLDATFNPDFAQVEADQVVLNLTTYETYYPEKRPFFLEGADVFTTPFQLVYTRRIGKVSDTPILRGAPYNEQLVDVPNPTTIYGASKLTGQLADRWTIGTLQALTAENTVQVQLADGTRQNRVADPMSAFNVVRLKHDLGGNAHIGMMATAVTHAESSATYPSLPAAQASPTSPFRAQQQCPDGTQLGAPSRCFNNAYVGAIDWLWRSPGGDYATGGQAVTTTLGEGPTRMVPDGTNLQPGQVGYGMQSYFNKEGGEHWTGGTALDLESRRFEINDLGYNQRANQLSASASIKYRELKPSGIFRERYFEFYSGQTVNVDGLLTGMGQYLQTYGKLTNLWTYFGDVYIRSTKFDDREVGDGTALQRKGRIGTEVSFGTDTTKRVALNFDQETASIYDGIYANGNLLLTTRVLPQFDFDIGPTWLYTRGEPRFIADGNAIGEYIFGKQKAENLGATLRATYTFAPRLTLQAYGQLFLASEHYQDISHALTGGGGPGTKVHLNDLLPYTLPLAANPDVEQAALNINLVLRWEYMLGSTLFAVYTRQQVPNVILDNTESATLNLKSVGRAPAADAFYLKISYWFGT